MTGTFHNKAEVYASTFISQYLKKALRTYPTTFSTIGSKIADVRLVFPNHDKFDSPERTIPFVSRWLEKIEKLIKDLPAPSVPGHEEQVRSRRKGSRARNLPLPPPLLPSNVRPAVHLC